jgi:very-short-patch-repair endonuclease
MTVEFLTRADLLHGGLTRRSIQAAVRRGELLHIRRDRYLRADTHEEFARAVRVGGRLTCLSLLALLGVFVLENRHLHVHVDPTSSRLRFARKPETRFGTARRRVRVHWTNLIEVPGSSCSVQVLDALAHAVVCQTPRTAVATIDSALHLGLVVEAQLAELFAALPARFRALQPLVDGRAESGPESLVRIMARMLGCDIQLQVEFDGIGRVDLVLDGWLVVECDSKQFHASWEAQQRDRNRDLALAARGYCTIRLTAATIMYRPDEAFAALRGLVESRRG